MPRTLDPHYARLLRRYINRAWWIQLLLNLQGVFWMITIIGFPLSIFLWTQAGNLAKSRRLAAALLEADDLPDSDTVIATLITSYDYLARFLLWHVLVYSILLGGATPALFNRDRPTIIIDASAVQEVKNTLWPW